MFFLVSNVFLKQSFPVHPEQELPRWNSGSLGDARGDFNDCEFWTAWTKFLIHSCTVSRFGVFLVYFRRVFIRYKSIHQTLIYFSLWAINDFWRLAKQQFGLIRAIKFQQYELHFLLNNLKLGAYPVEAAYYSIGA